MSPGEERSFEMSIAHSPSVPRTTGSSISLPFHLSTAGGSAMCTHSMYVSDLPPGGRGCETRRHMDFDLSEDQVALQSGARELLDARASSVRLRAHSETGRGYDAELWSA